MQKWGDVGAEENHDYHDQIDHVLAEGDVRSLRNRRACMKRHMNVKEESEVCKDRVLWHYASCKGCGVKIPSTNGQRSSQQYLQLPGQPYSAIQVPASTFNTAAPTYTLNDNNPANPATQPRPTTGLPSFSALSLPSLLAELSQPNAEKPSSFQSPSSPNIDAKLLNNLAIALQLLIVSNIMNTPPPDVVYEKPIQIKPEPIQASYNYPEISQSYPIQAQYYLSQEQINPVLKNYAESNAVQNYQPSRRSLSLIKSPYEALASSSYADPVAQYSSLNSRKDLKSPYAMMDKDLFSMNELF